MKKFLSLILTLLTFTAIAEAKDLRFVQITDVNFLADNNNTMLQSLIKDINKQKDVEFVVFTGDNIAKPSEDELKAFLKTIKPLKKTYYIVVGDRDVNKLKHLSKEDYAKILNKKIRRYEPETLNYSFLKDDVAFVVADGSKDVIPTKNGYYKDDVLEWLDSELAKYQKNNIIILQHFPVVPPAKKESYYTYRADDYLKIVAKHKNVKAIIAGHFDVNNEQFVNGIQHISTASFPYYRVIDVIDYETNNPTIWAELKNANHN